MEDRPKSVRAVYIWVALAALATNALSLAASHLWVYPDSIDYIVLAGGIADRADFTNELYLVRTPGYPLLLAILFRLFGAWSPAAILVIQHAMAVATAVLTAALAWRLTARRDVAWLAGVMCACSLQVLAYTNLVLTETPFTLTMTALAWYLVRFHQDGRRRDLAWASVLCGIGYLLKPICLSALAVCVLVALHRVWRSWRTPLPGAGGASASPTRGGAVLAVVGVTYALGPALAVAAPWMALSAVSHHSLQATCCLDYVLYLRAVTFDGLDSTTSVAMREIHETIAEAIRKGDLPPTADYRDRQTVIDAYRSVRNATFAKSSAVLGRAGRDLMREHPWAIAAGTVKYAAWMMISPDPVYRFQPGGARGVGGKRDTQADIYDIGTYSQGEGSWAPVLARTAHYLPLTTEPRALTPLWMRITQWLHRTIENGAPIVGLGDSPYEELALLALLAGGLSLWTRQRTAWLIVGAIVALHVLVSAFLGGPQTRYTLPIKPLMCLYFSLPAGVVFSAIRGLAGGITASARKHASTAESPA
ncbi:MAG: glycosyltransferase family 39 protein [Phycisphaerales bacterium]|nr:glycosyltransferase family 39 protein [Phycisphaerales bacterium]